MQELPTHLEFQLLRFLEFDRNDQPLSAHFLNEGMFRAQSIDSLHEKIAHARGILDQLLLIENLERSQSQAIARLLRPNVVEWTTQRSIRLKVL